jgi:CheY-like chemotaxis protein
VYFGLSILVNQSSNLNSLHVLIVEDEAVTRTALTVLLEYQGAIVTSVGFVQEGIQVIESGLKPDVLVSNIRLPDGNGARVLEAVRKEYVDRPKAAIALTGEEIETIQVDPESAGFQIYLPKPYEPRILLETIARLMQS